MRSQRRRKFVITARRLVRRQVCTHCSPIEFVPGIRGPVSTTSAPRSLVHRWSLSVLRVTLMTASGFPLPLAAVLPMPAAARPPYGTRRARGPSWGEVAARAHASARHTFHQSSRHFAATAAATSAAPATAAQTGSDVLRSSVAVSGLLKGVAAISPRNAWAVGSTSTSTSTRTVIEQWNGTTWK